MPDTRFRPRSLQPIVATQHVDLVATVVDQGQVCLVVEIICAEFEASYNPIVQPNSRSAINISPVAKVQHGQGIPASIDLVDDTVVTHSDAPSIPAGQLDASARPWLMCRGSNRFSNMRIDVLRQMGQLFLSRAKNEKGVTQESSRSISDTACSKGTAVSPEAFAASYARMHSNASSSSTSWALVLRRRF